MKSINTILDEVEHLTSLAKQEKFNQYLSSLKPGDLIQVKESEVISAVQFADKPINKHCPALGKHIIWSDYDFHVWMSSMPFGRNRITDEIHTALLIQKDFLKSKCRCFFSEEKFIKSSDLIVLLKERLYYVRITSPTNI